MNIEQLPSGSYRIRQMYKGKYYCVTLNHKPTKKEATILIAEKMQNIEDNSSKSMTFDRALSEYIEIKSNVLSPSTIRGYEQLRRMYSDTFKAMNIYDITATDIQKEVNDYASTHSAKSTKNYSGLISAVIGLKRPNMIIRTTLPQEAVNEAKIPTHDDIMRVIKALEGTPYHIAVQLACLGLRKSEIIALTVDDLDGNMLTIDKAIVTDKDNKLVDTTTKTVSSNRTIFIPDDLANEIRKTGYIYKGYPNSIIRALHRTQDALGVPRCKLHELRHFYVSFAHSQGMSDADIIKSIGHKTDAVMKKVYRHAIDLEKEQNRIANSIFS